VERRIGLAGDWHGNLLWTESRIRLFAEVGITSVQQLGDFELWPAPTGKMFHYRAGAE
jgi:hypothetical protein